MENIKVQVNITGLQELDQAVEDVKRKCMELQKSLSSAYAALDCLGCEINQPPTETDD